MFRIWNGNFIVVIESMIQWNQKFMITYWILKLLQVFFGDSFRPKCGIQLKNWFFFVFFRHISNQGEIRRNVGEFPLQISSLVDYFVIHFQCVKTILACGNPKFFVISDWDLCCYTFHNRFKVNKITLARTHAHTYVCNRFDYISQSLCWNNFDSKNTVITISPHDPCTGSIETGALWASKVISKRKSSQFHERSLLIVFVNVSSIRLFFLFQILILASLDLPFRKRGWDWDTERERESCVKLRSFYWSVHRLHCANKKIWTICWIKFSRKTIAGSPTIKAHHPHLSIEIKQRSQPQYL